jgi:hypothetical protein
MTIAVICAVILPSTLSWSGADKVEMKRAGVHLKNTGYGKMGKFAVDPRLSRVAFYADADYVLIPPGIDYKALNDFLSSNEVSLLMVDARTINSSVNGFKKSLRSRDLEKIDLPEFDTYKEYSIDVYRIKTTE